MSSSKSGQVTTEDICVVIPIFRAELTQWERLSLDRCLRILRPYTLVAIKPSSLAGTSIPAGIDDTISFDDAYFTGVEGYNRLMLSPMFYSAFRQEFKVMLIYQLDAFVFRDELLYWSNTGYDYIGAPWPHEVAPPDLVKKIKLKWRNYLAVKRNKMDEENGIPHRYQIEGNVGNGGFSLRNIAKFHEIARQEHVLIKHYLDQNHHHYHEDVFWGVEVNRKRTQLRIPGAHIARKFAFENFPERLFAENQGKLPFGCHAWDKHIDFWKPIFGDLAYHI